MFIYYYFIGLHLKHIFKEFKQLFFIEERIWKGKRERYICIQSTYIIFDKMFVEIGKAYDDIHGF